MSTSTGPTDNQAVLVLSENGMIQECNQACETIFGYLSGDMLWKHISMLLPQLAGMAMMRGDQINPRLHYLAHIGHQFEVVGVRGIHFASQLFINEVQTLGHHYLRLIVSPV